MEITAAVVRSAGGPFLLEELDLAAPRATEVQVEMRAVGICHTDLLARDGLYPTPHPLVCGHEGAGVVVAVGEDVSRVSPGDSVVLSFASCGACRNCLQGRSPYCDDMFRLNFGGRRADGSSPLSRDGELVNGCFGGQSSFASHALVDHRALTKVGGELPFERLAPLACAVQTGAGAVANVLAPEPGSSIAIFGTGSVGLCATMMAAVAGCDPIIAIDRKPSRLEAAIRLGATHAVDAAREDPVAAVRDITGGGADHSLEVSGVPSVLRQAVECLRETGVCGLVGAAPYGAEVTLDMTCLLRGRTVRGVIIGDSTPDVFIPELIDLHLAGRLPFDRLVEVFPFDRINEASAASEAGEVIKPVLVFA
jgi:aryl-alcohol dehydrogenase